MDTTQRGRGLSRLSAPVNEKDLINPKMFPNPRLKQNPSKFHEKDGNIRELSFLLTIEEDVAKEKNCSFLH